MRPRPEPGVYFDVPFDEYQQWDAWNPSTIKIGLDESMMAMKHVMDMGSESSDSMDLGTACHLAILQPDLLSSRIVVWPEGRRAGKVWDAFEAEHANKLILTAKEYAACIHIRDCVRAHRPAADLFGTDGRTEAVIVWEDSATGAMCKGRTDWLAETFIADLKTAADPKPRGFMNAAVKYQYYVSMGAYMDGLWTLGKQIETAHFVVVGNKPWHDVVVYDMSPQSIRVGIERWQKGLARALECERLGRWPGCAPEPVVFELPEWVTGGAESLVTVGGEAIFEDEEN